MSEELITAAQAKQQAKAIRAELKSQGVTVSHSESLERVARRYGFRDWNTFSAAVATRLPAAWSVGGRVRGSYRGHAFAARLLAVEPLKPGWYRVTLKFDEAVDMVRFDSFSNWRQRVTGVVGPAGVSREKSADGQPQLVLEM